NVRESLDEPEPSFGIAMRGRLNQELATSRWNISGEVLGQAYLDVQLLEESKLLVNSNLDVRYGLSRTLQILGHWNHFRKSFYDRTGSYDWTDYDLFMQFSPATRFSGWFGYRGRQKTLAAVERFRFLEHNLEARGRYQFGSKTFLEGTVRHYEVDHRDIPAVGVADDTSLVSLEYSQEDEGQEGYLHLRYRGKAIMGLQVGLGRVNSNSVIGEYRLIQYRIYLSGQLRPTSFYHIVFRRIEKDYQYPELEGITQYRDPEEPDQNLAHLRVEQVLSDDSVGYVQLSLLRNETILNRRYYNKTLIEVGLKVEF
ncbi:MAG: hypothetical protein JSU61_10305, partial [Fidelibacterota bacterium]